MPVCHCLAVPFVLLFALPSTQSVLERMDVAAASFHGMTASVRHVTHTAVIDDDSTETGTVKMRKLLPGEVEGLIDFTSPDRKIYLFKGRKAQIYTPISKTVQVYDLGKHGEQLDQFLMIGFGTAKAELERGYDISVVSQEEVEGRGTTRLRLIPRSKEALNYVKTMDLWISDATGYPVQEKVNQPSGDSLLVVYDDVKINPPLSAADMKLDLPKDVTFLYPQK